MRAGAVAAVGDANHLRAPGIEAGVSAQQLGGYGNVDLHRSIVVSSDVYYYVLANDLGVDAIHDFM